MKITVGIALTILAGSALASDSKPAANESRDVSKHEQICLAAMDSKDAAKAKVGHRGRPVATMQWFLPGHAFVMSREPATRVERVCWIIAANHF